MSTPARPPRRRWFWIVMFVVAVGLILFLRRPGKGAESRLTNLRAQGMPVSLEDLENALGTNTAAGRRNAALLVEVGEKIRLDQTRSLPPRGVPPSAVDRAWAQKQLEGDNAAPFAELRRQLQGGPWCFADYSGGIANPSMSHLGRIKRLAVALEVEAVTSAVVGEANRAAQALRSGLMVGRTVESGGVLIDYLVRVVCDTIAARSAETVFTRLDLPDESLVQLQQAFRAAEGTNALARALIGERAFGLAVFCMTPAQQNAAVNAAAGAAGMPAPTSGNPGLSFYHIFLQNSDRRYYLDQMERLIQAVQLPGPEARSAVQTMEKELRADQFPWRHLQTHMFLASLLKSVAKDWRHAATMRGAQTGCAVERFRATNGRLPSSLGELVPAFLESVPLDPMSGDPLKYRRLEPGYVIYSVGEDDTDDGGMEFSRRPKKSTNGWDYTFVVER